MKVWLVRLLLRLQDALCDVESGWSHNLNELPIKQLSAKWYEFFNDCLHLLPLNSSNELFQLIDLVWLHWLSEILRGCLHIYNSSLLVPEEVEKKISHNRELILLNVRCRESIELCVVSLKYLILKDLICLGDSALLEHPSLWALWLIDVLYDVLTQDCVNLNLLVERHLEEGFLSAL